MESPERAFNPGPPHIAKDLESLYGRLKVVAQTLSTPENSLEHLQKETREVKTEPVPTEVSETQPDEVVSDTKEGCKCKIILSGSNKTACNLCGDTIHEVVRLVQDKLMFQDEVEVMDELIKDEKTEKERLESLNRELEQRIEKLEDDLDERCDKMTALEQDLNIINAKYIGEIEKISEVQHSKALVEHELEELSKNLFEEANKMVSDEARSRNAAELAKESLENEVLLLRNKLYVQTNLNRDLKKKLRQTASTHTPSISIEITQSNDSLTDEDHDSEVVMEHIEEDDEILDENQLEQFETFAASCVNSPYSKVLQHPFLKRCLEEDIEPCLKFGFNARIYPRRIVDAIVHCTLQITTSDHSTESSPASSCKSPSLSPEHTTEPELISPTQTPTVAGMWSRWSNVAAQAISAANKISTPLPAKGCHACGQEASCPYRLQLVERQDPIPLDKFCRDRIVACQDFFAFISGIREGVFNARRIDDLYTESLRLRLRMFYARLGFLPSYGIEIPRTLEYSSSPSLSLAPLLNEVDKSTSPRWPKSVSPIN